jgi:hypothetical protein
MKCVKALFEDPVDICIVIDRGDKSNWTSVRNVNIIIYFVNYKHPDITA